jgi:hypothetical protein
MSTDIQFTFYGDKNGFRYHGFETHTDKDGDKIIWGDFEKLGVFMLSLPSRSVKL